MNGPARLLALACALVGAALFGACDKPQPARFPHDTHMTKAVLKAPGKPDTYLTCTSCHPGVRQANADAYPTAAVCAQCHTDQRNLPREPARADIRFEHDYHLALPDIHGQCVKCHVGVTETPSTAVYPPMSACLTCHQKDFDQGRCTPCHASPGQLRDLPPQTFMRHDTAWIRRHGLAATPQAAKVCNQCHAQAYCADCHDTRQPLPVEVRRPDAIQSGAVHRGDFVTRHAIEASSQPATCLRCHAPSSCDSCHVARGISPGAKGSVSPHPRTWVSGGASSPDFHGRAAKHDILGCVACHDQGPATNCITCHKVGGSGGKPHPGGWTSSRTPRTDTPCRYCHGGA
jgi:hypothetical protein